MNDLQTVAFESSAYDSVAHWNGSKQELKEVEIQKKAGYRKQDFTEAAFGLNKPENAEINDPVQNGLQQRNEGPAGEHDDLSLIRLGFFRGNEITACRDKTEGKPGYTDQPGSGSHNDLPSSLSSGNPVSQCVA
jgi:hypothetical protein